MATDGGVAGGDGAALPEAREGPEVVLVGGDLRRRPVVEQGDESQPGPADQHHRHERVGAERRPHRRVGQVVGVAQQQGHPLALGELVERLGQHDLVVVDGQDAAAQRQIGVARRHPAAPLARAGEPPADRVLDGLGLRRHDVDEVQRTALDDLERLGRTASEAPHHVVDAVQVDPHGSYQVLGGHARRPGLHHAA